MSSDGPLPTHRLDPRRPRARHLAASPNRLCQATVAYTQVGVFLYAAAVTDRPSGWVGLALAWGALEVVERTWNRGGPAWSRRAARGDDPDVGEMVAAYLAWIERAAATRHQAGAGASTGSAPT
jgi:hypothetical protein